MRSEEAVCVRFLGMLLFDLGINRNVSLRIMNLSALSLLERVEESLSRELAGSDCERLKGAEVKRVLDFYNESALLNVEDSKAESPLGTLAVQSLPKTGGRVAFKGSISVRHGSVRDDFLVTFESEETVDEESKNLCQRFWRLLKEEGDDTDDSESTDSNGGLTSKEGESDIDG